MLTGLFLPVVAVISRADVAVLREKGPRSGSVFSNPGIAANSPKDLKIALRTADVKIRLRLAEGGNLAADCVATFELVDIAPQEAGTRSFLVAFPVTGLRSHMVTVGQFHVLVDDKEPATVLRSAITISRRVFKLEDTPVNGQLDARFAPEKEPSQWAVFLADENGYRDSYVWQQSSQPGVTTHVRVTYTVTLRPQSIHYSKSYESADDDGEVIPFRTLEIDKWNDRYFFFDYVLLSGATWDGPIGREAIEISGEPTLQLDLHRVESFFREPIGHPLRYKESGGISEFPSTSVKNGIAQWILHDEKPSCDLLLAIPVSAVNLQAPVPAK
jgi:hypothetical protein